LDELRRGHRTVTEKAARASDPYDLV